MRKISIIGSTGSIGRQTLSVLDHLKDSFAICALAAGSDAGAMELQARKYRPEMVSLFDENAAADLRIRLKDTKIRVLSGDEGVSRAASLERGAIAVIAAVGMAGLRPLISAVRSGADVALANKESLVCAGAYVMELAKKHGVRILPVDSEHSAIFQCLDQKSDQCEINRIILTASGGPFYGKKHAELERVTAEQALKHPNWKMGNKITIDSATMMNKGFELIEARWLYNVSPEKIDMVVHRQSIVHSLVEFCDHSVLAQLSVPDMRLAIQYALTYPKRAEPIVSRLDLTRSPALTFSVPDEGTFGCLPIARRAALDGGNFGAIINGANEEAVGLFLGGKISFNDIPRFIEHAIEKVRFVKEPSLEDVFLSDKAAREAVLVFSER